MLRHIQSWAVVFAVALMNSAVADVDGARSKGVAWLLKNQRGDGSWASADGALPVQATSLGLNALDTAGLARSPAYAAARSYIGNADADSIDSIARKASSLALARTSAAAQAEADRMYSLRSLRDFTVWSSYGASGIDIVDTALALQALRTADSSYASKQSSLLNATCLLIPGLQAQPGGGLSAPSNMPVSFPGASTASSIGKPSVLATTLLLYEFDRIGRSTPSVGCNDGTGNTTYTFASLNQSMATWLLSQQNADGGFGEPRADGSKGPSSLMVTANAYRSLSNLSSPQTTAAGQALNWLLSRQDSSGHWGGDALLTAQVLAVWPYSSTAVADANRDGIPDTVTAALGSDSTLPGARDLLKPPTLATAAPRVFTGAKINTYYALGPTVVTQAFNPNAVLRPPFRITAGALPPGMSLDASSGQIFGTPTGSGSYSFQISDSVGNTSWDRIDVSPAVTGSVVAVVPMPDGATVAMAVVLIGIVLSRRPGRRSWRA